jgi:hypothetical protein
MIDLPASTRVGRVVAKEKFYTKTNINTRLRQMFTDEVDKIIWANKIAPDTLNITAKDYAELQVFEIALKGSDLGVAVLKHIDTFIPYPILFILKQPNTSKAVISFKESSSKSKDQMKVDSYYETRWQPELNLELKGRSVDEIYKHFLYQIAPELRQAKRANTKEAIATTKEMKAIQNQIDAINRRIANEPSIARRQELARERHALEQQMPSISL